MNKSIILQRAAAIKAYDNNQPIQFKHPNSEVWTDFSGAIHIFGPWDICEVGVKYSWRVKVQPDVRYIAIGVDPKYGDAYHTTGCYSTNNPGPFRTGKFSSDSNPTIYNVVGKLRLEFDPSTNKLIKVEMING